tara:strand:+ start:1123 stop:2928 length:1806 start_codon:yes stop_codon:yes gene_type:complete
MCGIYGHINIATNHLQEMGDIINHRGPDGEGTYESPNVCLGHKLLSIRAKVKHSKQPWKTKNGNILVYNGEIYNAKELKTTLIKKGCKFKTKCDTEILAHGLDTFGVAFIKKMDSMHSFVYYDKKLEQLIFSVDHAGMKPLYYSKRQGGLFFSSEIKSLKTVESFTRINSMAFIEWCRFGVNMTQDTLYKGVSKFTPGETKIFDVKKNKFVKTIWNRVKPTESINYDPDELYELLENTMLEHFQGVHKFGLYLSGGIDSMTILHFLLKHDIPFHSITTGNQTTHMNNKHNVSYNDDLEMVRKIRKIWGYDEGKWKLDTQSHQEILYKEHWYKKDMEEAWQTLEEPTFNFQHPLYLHCNKQMKEHGVKVTLSGDGGDELFAGYHKYHKDFDIRPGAKNVALQKIMDQIWEKPLFLKMASGYSWNYEQCKKHLLKVMRPYYNKNDWYNSWLASDVLDMSHRYFMRNDKFSMSQSMEGRFPLMGKKLRQYAYNVSAKWKYNQGIKLVLRLAMQRHFPKELFEKEKTGWSLPSAQWINNSKGSIGKSLEELWPTEENKISIDKAFDLPIYVRFKHRLIVKGLPTKSLFAMARLRKWAKHNNMTLY